MEDNDYFDNLVIYEDFQDEEDFEFDDDEDEFTIYIDD